MKNNKGFTLIELMIYIVLGVLVIGYALQAVTHLSKSYVHGREVTKMQQNGRDAINVLARDLANTGFKYYMLKTLTGGKMSYDLRPTATSPDSLFLLGSHTGRRVHSGTPPADAAASFYFGNIATYDSIEIFRGNLGSNLTITSIERVTYKVSGTTLYRLSQRCTNQTLVSGNIDWSTPVDTIAVLENVKGLQFQYSADGVGWVDAPTNIRHTMKYIKASLLVASDRESDFGADGKNETVGGTTIQRDDDRLYRSYEEIIPIPNNGVL